MERGGKDQWFVVCPYLTGVTRTSMKLIQRTPTILGVEEAMNTIKRMINATANFPEKERDCAEPWRTDRRRVCVLGVRGGVQERANTQRVCIGHRCHLANLPAKSSSEKNQCSILSWGFSHLSMKLGLKLLFLPYYLGVHNKNTTEMRIARFNGKNR